MKLLDTMVLVSAMNPADKYHKTGKAHLRTLQSSGEGYVPTSTLMEFDLVLRNRGYYEGEIKETWDALAPMIGQKIVVTFASAHLAASDIRSKGVTYFDSLIATTAKERVAVVVTRDPAISRHVATEW